MILLPRQIVLPFCLSTMIISNLIPIYQCPLLYRTVYVFYLFALTSNLFVCFVGLIRFLHSYSDTNISMSIILLFNFYY
jgi:hypothetical protein